MFCNDIISNYVKYYLIQVSLGSSLINVNLLQDFYLVGLLPVKLKQIGS